MKVRLRVAIQTEPEKDRRKRLRMESGVLELRGTQNQDN